ncbi:SLC1 [Candida oxycetoniae]|uniref:1-acyl-sn-glycerol-3-phosphate acyltransferase n=1 Tax=Candida oxycetoniae TaxID=497107 RepID=A0AAI9SZ19_9ASCO|nr:SLC1 [Candida oxycetoniae]KAI3405622.1 SLC1 [Candida oxycetoniae]
MTSSILSKVKFYFKCTVCALIIAASALYGVICSILLRIVGKIEYAQYSVARTFFYTCRFLLGINIKIKNEHLLTELPAIVISNHQSALDIHVLGRIFQPGYTVTSKDSLKYTPFLGWFMLLSGTFFLNRSKSSQARKVLNGALQDLKNQKRALFMFPEGTRSASRSLDMLPFKKGAFHLAKEAGIPIIPVVVSNTSTIFDAKNKIFNTGEINIEVLPPVSTACLETNEDVTKLCADVRKSMIDKLKSIGYSKVPGVKPNQDDYSTEDEDEDENDTNSEIEVISEGTPLVSGD